jgi:hypothetical protein
VLDTGHNEEVKEKAMDMLRERFHWNF